MKLKDKVLSIMGLGEDDYHDDEFEVPTEFKSPSLATKTPVQQVEQERQPLRAVEPKQNNRGQVTPVNTQTMMNKVIIRELKDYNDTKNIADCLKESLPVFVNLQRLDKTTSQRVIDYLSWTIYAIDGFIQEVGNNLYLCTPKSVETDGKVTETTRDGLSLGEL